MQSSALSSSLLRSKQSGAPSNAPEAIKDCRHISRDVHSYTDQIIKLQFGVQRGTLHSAPEIALSSAPFLGVACAFETIGGTAMAEETFDQPSIHLNRIYTRAGDGGETRLAGGQRLLKDDLRIECYGTVDELNAFVGSARVNGGTAGGASPGADSIRGHPQARAARTLQSGFHSGHPA